MTKEEAKLFFPYDETDNLSDLYNERLFEFKQFFLVKTPIRKVFEAKLLKLDQMDNAYRYITNLNPLEIQYEEEQPILFSNDVLEAFLNWENVKGQIKQQISVTRDAQTLKCFVLTYLKIVDNYRSKWNTNESIDIEIEQLAKDEDPMQIFEAIKQFNRDGGKYFNDIPKMNSNKLLLKEMKRISLLNKNYGNGGSI